MATHATIPTAGPAAVLGDPEEKLIPVYVWELPVRLAHWGLVTSIAVLSVTGYYLHRPYLEAHSQQAWVMGTMRFVHELFGFVLFATLILRVYWFFAGNSWASWRAYIPLTRHQWQGAGSMVSYYAFRRREPLPEIGHNPLAAMSYLVIYSLVALEVLSGLVLFSYVVGNRTMLFLFGWITRVINIQYIRSIHFLIMFLFIAFFVHHVYSAMLVSMEEKNGLMESIFTGWKFVTSKLHASDPGSKGGRK